jgi:hypothetical protein
MLEDYEAVYTHPSGATAIFTRHDGSLDAVARGLDSEQFWVFKNVKSLLIRNEEDDLDQATRLMASIGFTAHVRKLELVAAGAPVAASAGALAIAPAAAGAVEHAAEAHGEHPHAPPPSYWPLFTGAAVSLALCGLIVVNWAPYIPALGLILTFIGMIGWGVEPFEA